MATDTAPHTASTAGLQEQPALVRARNGGIDGRRITCPEASADLIGSLAAQPAWRQPDQSSPARRPHGLGLCWHYGGLVLAGKENLVPVDGAMVAEFVAWVPYLLVLQARRGWIRLASVLSGTPPASVSFWPDRPRAWYLLSGALAWAGIATRQSPDAAGLTVTFDDTTVVMRDAARAGHAVNSGCADITKSYVAALFEAVFGYPLACDPYSHQGPIVEKPEINGAHGGRVVMAPLVPVPRRHYQKLVDTRDSLGRCHDLRTPCIGGRPVFVWRKIKPPERRFGIQNSQVRLQPVASCFSDAEVVQIIAFNARIGLECGGLDILRDGHDGRIYIVDVNKTDIGPPIALPWHEKMASMDLLGQAVRVWLNNRTRFGSHALQAGA
jgi:hypothetical protein